MDKQAAAALVIEIAKTLIGSMPSIAPNWQRAFMRFNADESHHGCTGSFVTAEGVKLLGAFEHGDLYDRFTEVCLQMRETMEHNGRKFCVCLLIVDSDYNYSIKYEYHDPEKWRISKLDGGSGIPAGLE